jgi:Mg-chelatase subunit ChlD
MNQQDNCAICLATAAAKGGEFLVTPGCCGKWFHQSCIVEMQNAGKNFCPACRTPFPTPVAPPAPVVPLGAVSAPAASMFVSPQQQQFVPQQQQRSPPQQTVASSATGIFSRIFSSRRPSAGTTTSDSFNPSSYSNPLEEDEIVGEKAAPIPTKALAKADPGSPQRDDLLAISLSPEYGEETLAAKAPFYVRVSTVFTPSTTMNEEKTPLDVVCVLDNSGSMSGSKIDNLKAAMEFVISTLSDKDRLSVVTFNSNATALQGLWKMNDIRKETTRRNIQSIVAGGGTDIYAGMNEGWHILQSRKTKNPASCMFLLTDGQDGSKLEEKKALAKSVREQGTALFVFGFGNDHDSAHLIQIANAGEGSFIYIETNDTVIDAFGGAIGSQQGQLLKDININISMTANHVILENILAGSYHSSIGSEKRNGSVTFADLFGGERRDFLLQLSLPMIQAPIDVYELLSVQATYRQHGIEEERRESRSISCSIRRISNEDYQVSTISHERDTDVDAQLQRLTATQQIKSAIALADSNKYEEAKTLLSQTKNQLLQSISYVKKSPMIITLLDDVKDCEQKVSSRNEYETYGGKAFMTENASMHSKQRAVYAKKSSAPMSYQSCSSSAQQQNAVNYKSAPSTTTNKKSFF